MTVRQRLEQEERTRLSPYAKCAADTAGRAAPISPDDMRTDFQRDRDRIIHCKSFRRLKYKTQVFLSPVGDHYRTRLTHTLEVAQVARTLARCLQLNEDLTEAIALGHDLGHTPFGHIGENTLNKRMPGGFRHNEQSLRMVERLEREGAGLNLCQETRDGILCHSGPQEPSTLEGWCVRRADRIAYINHDIDDAIRGGVLTEDMLPASATDVLGHSKSERITTLIMSIVKNGVSDIHMDDDIQQAFNELRNFMFEHVYSNSIAKAEEYKAKMLVEKLYRYFIKYPDKMPEEYINIMNRFSKERAVCDYVSGMTDLYAVNLYNELFIPKSWKLT